MIAQNGKWQLLRHHDITCAFVMLQTRNSTLFVKLWCFTVMTRRHTHSPLMFHVSFTHLPTGQAFWNQLYITQSQIMGNGWINLQICLQTCQNSLSVSASASQDQRLQEKVSCQSIAYRGQQKRKECVSDNVLHKYEVCNPIPVP